MKRPKAKKTTRNPKAKKSLRRPRAQQTLTVTAETIFKTVKGIIEDGQEDEFLRLCKKQQAFVVVEPKHIDLVKDFLVKKRTARRNALAMSVVDSDRCTPPEQ